MRGGWQACARMELNNARVGICSDPYELVIWNEKGDGVQIPLNNISHPKRFLAEVMYRRYMTAPAGHLATAEPHGG